MPQNVRFETQGRALLLRFAKQKRLTQAQLARLFDVSQQTVSDWLAGETRPENHLKRAVIERVTCIPCEAWFLRAERELIRRAKAA